jgi:hypothetical protein
MDGIFALFSGTEYNGIKVKEWNIVQFSKLGGVLSAVAKEYQTTQADWNSFSAILEESDSSSMLDKTNGLLTSIQPFVTHAPAILSVSCNLTETQLQDMKYTDGIVLLLLVLKANLEHLNGFFGKLAANNATQGQTVSI